MLPDDALDADRALLDCGRLDDQRLTRRQACRRELVDRQVVGRQLSCQQHRFPQRHVQEVHDELAGLQDHAMGCPDEVAGCVCPLADADGDLGRPAIDKRPGDQRDDVWAPCSVHAAYHRRHGRNVAKQVLIDAHLPGRFRVHSNCRLAHLVHLSLGSLPAYAIATRVASRTPAPHDAKGRQIRTGFQGTTVPARLPAVLACVADFRPQIAVFGAEFASTALIQYHASPSGAAHSPTAEEVTWKHHRA